MKIGEYMLTIFVDLRLNHQLLIQIHNTIKFSGYCVRKGHLLSDIN